MNKDRRVDIVTNFVNGLNLVKMVDINILDGVLVRKYENGSYLLGHLNCDDRFTFYVHVINNTIRGIGAKVWRNEILKAIELFEKC